MSEKLAYPLWEHLGEHVAKLRLHLQMQMLGAKAIKETLPNWEPKK